MATDTRPTIAVTLINGTVLRFTPRTPEQDAEWAITLAWIFSDFGDRVQVHTEAEPATREKMAGSLTPH